MGQWIGSRGEYKGNNVNFSLLRLTPIPGSIWLTKEEEKEVDVWGGA